MTDTEMTDLERARIAAASVRPYSHNSALILDGDRDGTDIVRAALDAVLAEARKPDAVQSVADAPVTYGTMTPDIEVVVPHYPNATLIIKGTPAAVSKWPLSLWPMRWPADVAVPDGCRVVSTDALPAASLVGGYTSDNYHQTAEDAKALDAETSDAVQQEPTVETVTDEMRGAVARAMLDWGVPWNSEETLNLADAALLAMRPFIAAIEAAAEARGREDEATAIMDWLCDTYDPDDEHDERLDIAQAIEVARHIKHRSAK